MTKVLSVRHKEYWFECQYEEGEMNPYRLYQLTWKTNEYGYPYKSKKLVQKYADLKSVLCVLAAY